MHQLTCTRKASRALFFVFLTSHYWIGLVVSNASTWLMIEAKYSNDIMHELHSYPRNSFISSRWVKIIKDEWNYSFVKKQYGEYVIIFDRKFIVSQLSSYIWPSYDIQGEKRRWKSPFTHLPTWVRVQSRRLSYLSFVIRMDKRPIRDYWRRLEAALCKIFYKIFFLLW